MNIEIWAWPLFIGGLLLFAAFNIGWATLLVKWLWTGSLC